MKTIHLLIIALLGALTAAQKKRLRPSPVCTQLNTKRAVCVPGKGGCFGRVNGVSYLVEDVFPRGFVVRWKTHRVAKCYFVQVLRGFTSFPVKTYPCVTGTSLKVTGLAPWTMYGVQVSLVNRWCRRGPPNKEKLLIKTNWDETYVFKRPQAQVITTTPKPGQCGKRRFTCHTSKWKRKGRYECVWNKKWCDRTSDCADGSDERGCPGGCKEIDVNFKNGNYSCTRFGSPSSFCMFDCNSGYVADGSRSMFCPRANGPTAGKWSAEIPTCKLLATKSLEIIPEEITESSIAVKWEPVEFATRYVINAVHHGDSEAIDGGDVMSSKTINATECCTGVVSGLIADTEYEVAIYAIEDDGTTGMGSSSLFVRTELQDGSSKE